MIAFLDFEASSLSDESYPIEVGWVFEDGRAESHLIRPAPGWTDWDPQAEAIHGISPRQLLEQGLPHPDVAARMMRELAGHALYASAPSWDGKWLSVLLRAAGYPRHALRLRDTDEAQAEAARTALGVQASPEALAEEAAAILQRVRWASGNSPPAHRALPDARQQRDIWLEVKRQAGLAGRPSQP
jgi:hypothetical protein